MADRATWHPIGQWQMANGKLSHTTGRGANCHAGIGGPIRNSKATILSRSLVAMGPVARKSGAPKNQSDGGAKRGGVLCYLRITEIIVLIILNYSCQVASTLTRHNQQHKWD